MKVDDVVRVFTSSGTYRGDTGVVRRFEKGGAYVSLDHAPDEPPLFFERNALVPYAPPDLGIFTGD